MAFMAKIFVACGALKGASPLGPCFTAQNRPPWPSPSSPSVWRVESPPRGCRFGGLTDYLEIAVCWPQGTAEWVSFSDPCAEAVTDSEASRIWSELQQMQRSFALFESEDPAKAAHSGRKLAFLRARWCAVRERAWERSRTLQRGG